jgi:Glutathione-dependent formaldehyde-activating enzyme
MEAVIRTGGSLCGAVRYSVRGEPVHVRRCHCADSRKESGSAFTSTRKWPIEAFELSGDLRQLRRAGLLPALWSRILEQPDRGDILIEIRLGSLDDAPFALKLQDEIWVKRRESPGSLLSRAQNSTTRTAASAGLPTSISEPSSRSARSRRAWIPSSSTSASRH